MVILLYFSMLIHLFMVRGLCETFSEFITSSGLVRRAYACYEDIAQDFGSWATMTM